jgi:hypothetical protein
MDAKLFETEAISILRLNRLEMTDRSKENGLATSLSDILHLIGGRNDPYTQI